MAIPNVGKCFSTSEQFLDYLDGIQFGAWRPRFVTMHHSGGPNLKMWRDWQVRAKPVTDEQWMKNLASYYGSPPPIGPRDGPWRSGPHFFFTPKNFCVLSPPTSRGVHAKSFNAMSWGVECVGDFDSEPFDGEVRDRYIEGLACLHLATGLQLDPFERGVRGLHFHRDDPQTNKTCPGLKVKKPDIIALVKAKMATMTGGDHEDDTPIAPTMSARKTGTVNTDDLNVRASASGKAPIVGKLDKGDKVTITGQAKNGETTWLEIHGEQGKSQGYVAGRFVTLD